jgi:hypothetical protein
LKSFMKRNKNKITLRKGFRRKYQLGKGNRF